jgi:hypothetical protein
MPCSMIPLLLLMLAGWCARLGTQAMMVIMGRACSAFCPYSHEPSWNCRRSPVITRSTETQRG